MRIFYALIILLFATPKLTAQKLNFSPAEGNPALRVQANKEAIQLTKKWEKLSDSHPLTSPTKGPVNICPPNFVGNLLEAGDSLKIDLAIDTLVLGGGGGNDTLRLSGCGSLAMGTVGLDSVILTYIALPGVTGAGTDTVCIEFCRENGGGCDMITHIFTVKRKGKTIIADPETVDRETVNLYCLDDEIAFPGAKKCNRFLDCEDNYDGEGQQLISFTNYTRPDTCIIYYSNRFPGTDTVCVVICDEYLVCDTFKIPIIIRGDTLSFEDLPFFDDFSYPDPFPKKELWLDKQVFVNQTFAPNPPSIGLVTFDGIDRKGNPYDFSEGVADKLTSLPIDLEGLGPDDNLVLKFFVAVKGNGKAPSKPDSLIVEFRDNSGRWINIDGYPGMDPEPAVQDTFPPFEFRSYKLDDPDFFHEAFQFRFKAYTSPGGMVDLWHVDYVWFGQTPDAGDFFPDLAFVEPPMSILKKYTSMPWWHFEGNEQQELALNDTLKIKCFNHKNDVENIDEGTNVLEEITTATTVYSSGTSLTGNLEQGLNIKIFNVSGNILDQELDVLKNDFKGAEKLNFKATHWLVADQENEFLQNDTVYSYTPFDNYFSRDDGSSEWQVSFKTPSGGEQIAVKYQANVPDSLRAIRVLFPHINGDVQNQVFNLRVYSGDLTQNAEPIYEQELLSPFYPNNLFDTLQGFTTYRLEDFLGNETPVEIPAGDFYISFMQLSSGVEFGIPLGFDLNNGCDSCNFFKLDLLSEWQSFPDNRQNAIMIRPVFGDNAPVSTTADAGEVKVLPDFFSVYPNPASEVLYFQLKEGNIGDFIAVIFNNRGQFLDDLPLDDEISLADYQSGIYYIQFIHRKTKERFIYKLLIVK